MNKNNGFWEFIDKLVNESEIVIDRPKGSRHPKMENIIYEVDYGYLKNTKSMDGSGIDIWKGSNESQKVNGIFCTIDLYRKDSEIKILIGCTEDEINKIDKMYNVLKSLKGLLIKRD
ncbi:MAG: hypothetical protein LBD29_01795 [Treponema sp.]|jgi:inorganic pyrophosphatase|nr:hypothetical protein [Treponema sp.]